MKTSRSKPAKPEVKISAIRIPGGLIQKVRLKMEQDRESLREQDLHTLSGLVRRLLRKYVSGEVDPCQ